MCTYRTEQIAVTGSGKGTPGWISVKQATVYFDHPQHAMQEHTLNIDFADPKLGPSARVAVELSEASARALVEAITSILDAA
jgi:hypothetical protein